MRLRLLNRLRRRFVGRGLALWYHPAYRLPLAGLETRPGIEPRRSDFAAWFLVDRHIVPGNAVRTARPATYEELARVHTARYLESLSTPEALADIFAVQPQEVAVDEVMRTVRLAAGGTIDAARHAVRTKQPSLNLLGGFHHASPEVGGGFCAVNDIAVAVAALRAGGWRGTTAVLDLDAHPPDGTAACFADDPTIWIASVSGSEWLHLPRVDETVLPTGAGDEAYLAAVETVLSRMPRADLVFVIAGGDVLGGDRFGALGLTLDGARRRDLAVADALEGVASVWLPGGGYSQNAWRVLAGTGLAVALRTRRPIAQDYDPLSVRFNAIARGLGRRELGDESEELSFADLESALGLRRSGTRLLDFYTAEGLEYAFWRYGTLEQLSRLGYRQLRTRVDAVDQGDRMRVLGTWNDVEHVLIEVVVEKRRVGERPVLYIHWLTLRHPRALFEASRPKLPGQDVPGLGLAREASELLLQMAKRLDLEGIAFRPAWFHMAYAARSRFRFVDARRQGRFLAMVRDLGKRPLLEVTMAVADGRVRMNDAPYQWEADEMAYFIDDAPPEDAAEIAEERERVQFTLSER